MPHVVLTGVRVESDAPKIIRRDNDNEQILRILMSYGMMEYSNSSSILIATLKMSPLSPYMDGSLAT